MNRRHALRSLALGLAATAAPGCGGGVGARPGVLALGCYSVIREAIREGILPAFRSTWSRVLRFEESYAASGAQARAIASGYDADVALLSHEGDLDLLVKAKLVAGKARPVSRSLVVIGVREGNPAAIGSFADLARPGVRVLYADPKTSGGARWNLNAIWGSAARASSERDAADLLLAVQKNVLTMDPSGRASLTTFADGAGDAIVTYENELILYNQRAEARGRKPLESVVPAATLLIEPPGAVVSASTARHGNHELAEAFVEFLVGPGQGVLAGYGFRSLASDPPPGAFTMADLGGWAAVAKRLYAADGVWTKAVLTLGGARSPR